MERPDPSLKALEIMQACASVPEGMRMSDLVASTHMSRSTVFRLAGALQRAGYLRRLSGSQRLVLGYRILPLAASVVDYLDIKNLARPSLEELSQRTRETVHLVKREGSRAFYVDKIDSPQMIGLLSRIGMEVMLHSSGAGKVLLAYASPEERREIYQSVGLPRKTENTITDIPTLEAELEDVRDREYATDNGENRDGICCVGGPIFDHKGGLVASFSVAGPCFRFDPSYLPAIITAVHETSERISRQLGYAPPKRS